MLQHKMDRLCSFNRVANYSVGVDLVIVDIPDNLSIANISNANGEVPRWNVEKVRFLDQLFDFTSTHLQDDSAILLFHTSSRDLLKHLRGFQKVYRFKIHKEWMFVNRLRMTSAKDPSKMVSYFSPLTMC
jgi:hypothetical protein